MNKSFAVLGLGKFGRGLALELYENGADVLIVDSDQEVVDSLSSKATYAMVADLTEPESIRSLGLSNIDVVFICMAEHIESSIMCAMVAKEEGVPKVYAKVSDKMMGDILLKVGADEVSYVEEEAAKRYSRILMASNFIDYFDLSDDLCLINMKTKPEWVGNSLSKLNLRSKYGINVVAATKNGKTSQIDPANPLTGSEELLVVVPKDKISKLN